MKRKRILLLGGNYYPEPTGIGKYNAEMIDWLASHHYECGVVTTYPYYPFWQIQEPYVHKASWYKTEKRRVDAETSVIVYRCPHYVPAIPTGIKRVLSDISFFLSAFFQVIGLLFRKKYDFVMVVAPPFQIGLLGWMYKKIKGAILIYHIQDLQIDAAVGLSMIKSKYIVNMMFGLEKFILCHSDFISSISDGMIQKIKSKCGRPVILFPNWVDTQSFHPIENKDALKIQFGFLPSDKIILYSGAIGEKQGLQALLHTAEEMADNTDIKFIICGSGPYKDKLIEMAKTMGLLNVYFLPLQPTDKFNQFLNMADVHLVMQKANENELFMPSKLTTICAVGGVVVVTASENTSLYSLISSYNIGILVAPEDQSALTNAVKRAVYQDNQAIKNNACKFAADYLSIDKVVANYFSIINPDHAISPASQKKEEASQHNNAPSPA